MASTGVPGVAWRAKQARHSRPSVARVCPREVNSKSCTGFDANAAAATAAVPKYCVRRVSR